jgi:hypothetical protein
MAKKYVDISQTFNGDGTLSTGASSNGAPGAWNILKSALEGTPAYGSSSPGDDIYVRTHDGSSNLTETTSTDTVIMSGLTVDLPLRIFFDDGTVWPDSGLFTYETSAATSFNFVDYFQVFGVERNFRFLFNLDSNIYPLIRYNDCILHSAIVEFTGATSYRTRGTRIESSQSPILIDILNIHDTSWGSNAYSALTLSQYTGSKIIGFDVDFSSVPSNKSTYVFKNLSYGQDIIKGVEVIGDTTTTNIYYNVSSAPYYNIINNVITQNNLAIFGIAGTGIGKNSYSQAVVTYNNNSYDFYESRSKATSEWQSGQGYPTRSALLPDNSTPWSIRVFGNSSDKGAAGWIPTIEKYYSNTSSIRTVTAELLLNNYFTSPTKLDFYMIVSYTDSSGEFRQESTLDIHETALSTSLATWSSTTYNGDTHTAYKIEHITSYTIKQNTVIYIDVITYRKSATAKYWFLCPEIDIV